MACRYDLVVFDWDGTVDTTGLIARGICIAAKTLGYKEPSLALARATLYKHLRELKPQGGPSNG